MSHPPSSTALTGLNPAGLLLGALGDASASWPQEGPVEWQPPDEAEAAALFPGYADVRFLGRGGMGAVYAARQVSLDRQVALKLLPAELSRNPAAAERFRREARALAKLSHPNIVAVHEFGETAGGSFFFVMEHVEGSDLHRIIRDGRLTLPQALDFVRQICDALQYAHAQGFVHRDIKPANILVDTAGRVKVSDFGLARLVGETPDTVHEPAPTMTGGIVGTPDYIAPEQRAGDRPVDHRADIYSLGVMLYEMLTGSVPRGVFEPPSRKTGVSEDMDRVVLRAMQEEPGKRYQHAAEVKTDVDRAASRPALRWWLRAAALFAGALVAAGIWQLLARSREEVPKPDIASSAPAPVSKGKRISSGKTFLPSGTQSVLMAVTETTRADFAAFVSDTGHATFGEVYFPREGVWNSGQGSWESPPGLPPQTDRHAVVAITAADSTAYCEWLTQQGLESGELKPGERYRLPTAEEWARSAGLPLRVIVNTGPPSLAAAGGLTGSSPADASGFHDLHGGVAEWTSSPGRNADESLACGTGWADPANYAGVTLARPFLRTIRGAVLGFRIVLDATAASR